MSTNKLVSCLALAALLLASCGRPATQKDCEEIVTRVATLEYEEAGKGRGPVDSERLDTIRARVHNVMMKDCVGKRITENALRCVRQARSSVEIREKCFD